MTADEGEIFDEPECVKLEKIQLFRLREAGNKCVNLRNQFAKVFFRRKPTSFYG